MATFDDIVIMAKDVFEAAGKKTGEVVTYSKLRFSIANIEGDLAKAYKRLGMIVYDMTKHGLEEPELVDRCIEEIDLLKSQKEEAEKELEALKKTVSCPACGGACCKNASYCSSCGHDLHEE